MTHRTSVRLSKLSLALVAALAAAPVFAQSTSAGLAGQVTAAGQPVAGAEVTITHVESGTTNRVVTDASGRYNARGLCVGGPYTITVTKPGTGSDTESNVFLALNQVNNVDAQLDANVTELGTVQVLGTNEYDLFSSDKMGAGTNVSREQIEAFPSIERNLQDYARLDPRVVQTDKSRNEISVGGQNPRYNAIRVDGISTNDAFGLESNGLPTPRQPFSMDTIEEISVDVANYDVTISGGTGGVINAVTKSGTNEYSGSVYGLFRDNDWVRPNTDGSGFDGFADETTYGMTFGGPLIKDRLFFFLNYENYEQSAAAPAFGPVGSSASNIVGITQADIDAVREVAQDVYGFDPGNYSFVGADTTGEEWGLKIDWNITDGQRFNFRYGTSDQSVAQFPDFFDDAISLDTHAYQREYTFDTYTAQLFSDWSDSFSTEAKISFRDYAAVRVPTANLPEVEIEFGPNSILFGTEENTHANVLETQTWNAFFAGNLFLADHTIKFGFDYEDNDIYNLFGRRTNGVYRFRSIEDFAAGDPSFYQLFYPAGGNLDNMAAIWGLKNLGLFVQDTWLVNDNLTLTFGLRWDTPTVDSEPKYNAAAEAAFGFDNSATIDGNDLVQPRFGFNYTFDTERRTQLRGGVGLFQGASANVWLSNPFTNTGFGYTDYRFSSGFADSAPCMQPGNECFVADPTQQVSLIPPGSSAGVQAIDFVDPELGQPSIWKANLAFDTVLPWMGMVASAEAILTNVEEGIYYQQLNLGAPTRVGPDGRSLFWNAAGYDRARWNQFGSNPSGGARVSSRANAISTFSDAIIARPTNKGASQQLTLSLTKPFQDSDWYWMFAYTYTNATEVSPLTSSTSGSQWGNNAQFQANEEVAATSSYEIPNRFTGAVSWHHAFFGDYKTSVSLFYEARNGRPYSYIFDNDANGDARFGNDLLYIPAGRGDVLFGSQAEEDDFFAFVESDEYLSSHMGQIAERNGARAPWVHQLDLRFSQEMPGLVEGHSAEVWLDVLNVGNLINEDWGQITEIGFPLTRGVVEYGGIDQTTGKYVYRFNEPDDFRLYDDRGISRWSLQLGFRYKF